MIERFPAYGAGSIVCLALLIIFHLLWKDAHRTIRYMLGAGAICAGCTVAGTILDNPDLTIGPWVVTFWGLIIALWAWIDDRVERAKQNAQKNGELIGITKGLTQDLIDRGGRSDAQSGVDEARRRN